jgi:Ca-activated chloride channel family protein
VKPGEDLGEVVSSLYSQINNPVLTDLGLDFGDVITFDIYPSELPDLFIGNQLVLVGRYRAPGTTTIRLMGEVEGDPRIFRYEDEHFRSSGGSDFLPRLWATRKIGILLKQIRLQGPNEEVIDQIVRLSIRYGVVTPYTSYLVTAPEVFGDEAQDDLAEEALRQFMAAPSAVTGQEAVDRAAAESELGAAEAPVAPSGEAQELVRFAGSRTFRLKDGVWIDTAYEPEHMHTIRVPFLSEDYFRLAEAAPEIAPALALGEQVIVVSNGIAYEVVSSDEEGDPVSIPEPEVSSPVPISGHAETQPDHDPGSPADGLELLCPGAILGFGLLLVPLAMIGRRRGWWSGS